MDNIELINLGNYVKPEIKETYGRKWVTNGRNNEWYQYVIDRKHGSPTNESILNVYKQLLYGRGIVLKGQTELYDDLYDVFDKKEIRCTLDDYKTFGMFAIKLVRAVGGGVARMKHFPIDKLAMGKDLDGIEIQTVYYSMDWSNTNKYKPEPLPVFNGKMSSNEMILLYKPYEAGSFWYSYPDYLASLQYAQIEEEIANFSVNHIKKGLSFGYIINVANGASLGEEGKKELERRITDKLTGSPNAGQFVLSFNNGTEAEVTVVPLEVNDAHNQWESLREEAKFQILTGHGVTSPLLFGMPSATGFGSNADELDTASKLLQDYQISPKQEIFIDTIKPILKLIGLETDLEFLPLRDTYGKETTEEVIKDNTVEEINDELEEENVEMSSEYDSDNIDLKALIDKGEVVDTEEWELIEDERCDALTLSEDRLNMIIELASMPKGDSRKQSEQDTSLFKIRYRYAGNPLPQRSFCKKVMLANRVYRAEDLESATSANPDFAPKGKRTYNIFLYKGGVNCRHWWQRVIYLKKDNKKISVNQARKLILELDPKDRDKARWEQNPKEVAQIASPSNNHWKLN